ncbi:hypothetical protein [Spirosoma endophyticum]|uniref:Patatin-like phospholipase n=1 Tax=Spirosoma endophyticum TaxID=662367 RepID=A0A1I2BB43_9BACT|nr:hypothetical protein [Spirosoma endophyticum]SFE53432.1 hypothetical protein SAMN05216167_11550 [Spirosoma endophyticum]
MDKLANIPFIIKAAFIGLAIFGLIKIGFGIWLSIQISSFVRTFSAMPYISKDRIIKVLFKVIILNWYILFILILFWVVLFKIDIGKDLIEDYLSNIIYFHFNARFFSLWSLFICILSVCLAIWLIPFFLFTVKQRKNTIRDSMNFYIGTKLLAFLSIAPFYIIANAFFKHFFKQYTYGPKTIHYIILNIIVITVFIFANRLINSLLKYFPLYKRTESSLNIIFKNRYINILLYIFFWVMFIIIITSIIINEKNADYVVSLFLFISSAISFRLLFFTDESRDTKEEIELNVKEMLSLKNTIENRRLYLTIFGLVFLINFYYYSVPSLTATNSLYIILSIFSLYIFYLDFFRRLYQTEVRWKQLVSIFAFVTFFWAPFLAPPEQFKVPLHKFDKVANVDTSQSKLPYPNANNLEEALINRMYYVNNQDSSELDSGRYAYIVCGMGGGSRAGYFTSYFLQKVDKLYPNIWEQTICYSTVSGSSPGIYHYLTAKRKNKTTVNLIDSIYSQNYNSSGIFGLLLGDPFEALIGGSIGIIKQALRSTNSKPKYYDRNYRIKLEYDIAMNNALIDANDPTNQPQSDWKKYIKRTFGYKSKDTVPELFKASSTRISQKEPIHLINTFEINSGRRTVISPFVIKDSAYFPNTILPLQEKAFDPLILQKDISYRDAVNLSELFPLVSAASTIGDSSPNQFVDGGYFENYGLATGMNVANFLIEKNIVSKDRIKIVLIKNSLQIPEDSAKKGQLAAPLIGVINAPFTGHANHFQEDARRIYGKNNFKIFDFNSDTNGQRVPLTRALTGKQIQIMKKYINTIDISYFKESRKPRTP